MGGLSCKNNLIHIYSLIINPLFLILIIFNLYKSVVMKRILVDMDGVLADVMIDDHPKNLDNFSGETIIFSQPHNILLENTRHKRVKSWSEIENLLLSVIGQQEA